MASNLKTQDTDDGELDIIFLLKNDNTLINVQDATRKDLYTAMLRRTKMYYAGPNVKRFLEIILNGKTFEKIFNSGICDNWDFDIIYKFIKCVYMYIT